MGSKGRNFDKNSPVVAIFGFKLGSFAFFSFLSSLLSVFDTRPGWGHTAVRTKAPSPYTTGVTPARHMWLDGTFPNVSYGCLSKLLVQPSSTKKAVAFQEIKEVQLDTDKPNLTPQNQNSVGQSWKSGDKQRRHHYSLPTQHSRRP